MKIPGDPPALGLRAVDGSLEERGAVAAASLQAARQAPAQGDLNDEEEREPGDQRREDATPDALLVRLDRAVPLIGLEEKLGAVGGADR